MNVISRGKLAINAFLQKEAPTISNNNELFAGLFKLFQRFNPYYNPNFITSQDAIDNGYKLNPHIYSAVSYMSRHISKIPFTVCEVVDEKAYDTFLVRRKSLGKENSSLAEVRYWKAKSLKPT